MKTLILFMVMTCMPLFANQQTTVKRNPQMFYKGDQVTCIYNGVFSWSDGTEFMKTVPMECTIIAASEPWDMREYKQSQYYQHVHIDCTKEIEKQSGGPGAGLVRNHKLNYKKRWVTSEECYRLPK